MLAFNRSSVIPSRKDARNRAFAAPCRLRCRRNTRLSKPIARASSRKISTFGFVSPGAGSTGRGELQVVMPVCEVQVGVLEEGRDRQHDVGVVRRIGLELLQDYCEQVRRVSALE